MAESDVIREQAITALLGLAVEGFGITDAHDADADADADADQARLQRATTYMRRHLAEPISITELAREVGVSTRGLQLVFRRTGLGAPRPPFAA